VVARKPFKGTVFRNVEKHGTGAFNIDATRIATYSEGPGSTREAMAGDMDRVEYDGSKGRYPANFILTHTEECEQVGTRKVKTGTAVNRNRSGEKPNEVYGKWAESGGEDATYAGKDGMEEVSAWVCVEGCPVASLDEQSGERKAGGKVKGHEPSRTGLNDIYGTWGRVENKPFNDTGGASRFFYCAKASKKERVSYTAEDGKKIVHPTVKPLELIRWMVRLITPPGGIVLDPFAGSGTTLEAAHLEGFSSLGIELTEKYIPLIEARMARNLEEEK
jgi:site-specific DNA-methyltransferase (adenine-specific)